jgi:1,4-dihydroxy-2-naphthoate polyprenyltransferase
MESFKLFIRLTRPLFLLGVAIIYALGVGIARYLGHEVNWTAYLIGQAWVTLLQLSAQYLNEYFNAPADLVNPNRTYLTGGSGALGPGKLPRQVALYAALTCMAFLASLSVVLIDRLSPPPAAYLIMAIAFLIALFYSTPPLRLEASGYGELAVSVQVAFLVPMYAFLLQAGEMHRLVAMSAFPLFLLHLAMLLAMELPDYATDVKYEKRTLLVRLDWQTTMTMHNMLILGAYLLLLLAGLLGLPWFAVRAGMISLVVGLFQIWQMRNIARGSKPNWDALTIGAVAVFAATAYLLAWAFWTN